MAFKLSIKGKDTSIDLGEKVITSFNVSSATDDRSSAKTNIVATIAIGGKLLSNEVGTEEIESEKLYKWSLVPPENPDAYRYVTVRVIKNSKTIRRIIFPKAFVVDYHERYHSAGGEGEFSLMIRQKIDSVKDIDCKSGPSANEEDNEDDQEEENLD